ncbi:MAG: hypothetical protein O7G30_06535, partial [Proteobacteria bacterium]|nr:hypothetical protein [Pseudomonadota bacterium]
CKTTVIDIEDPLLDETGTPVGVGAGQHIFAAESCDEINAMEKRRGYPLKHWWWGTYFYDRDGKFTKAALRDGIPSGANHGRRDQANGCSGCLGHHWEQHDYFSHDGTVAAGGGGEAEHGEWLPDGWHRPGNGGSDGRWLQIFSD